MTRGRPRTYDEPVVITLKCERRLHDVMTFLKYPDRDVYIKGSLAIMDERQSDLTEEHIQTEIQVLRSQMADIQEHIAMQERMMMDCRIRAEARARQKKKVVVMLDDRGRSYEAVMAE